MNSLNPDRARILFLFSDTGGGHRSAAEAIIEALHQEYRGQIVTEMLDIFRESAPRPLNHMPEWYPKMVLVPQVWGAGFYLSNGRGRYHIISAGAYPYIYKSIQKTLSRHTADLFVSVHPLANLPFLWTMGKKHPPFVTVVTDLVTPHTSWFNRGVDLCIVPTEIARQHALHNGLSPEKVKVIGLPVARGFCQGGGDQKQARQKLGLPQGTPLVLLIGGGEGMGPIEEIARAIDAAELPIGLVIIAGRNQTLKQRLEAISWRRPTFIFGFVRNMPEYMQAVDILLSKAGPGTITEALNIGLPIILYSRLPGQESGNVEYVVNEGAGIWAPTPERIIAALKTWLEHPERLVKATRNARRLARPQAALDIAHILGSIIKISPPQSAPVSPSNPSSSD